MSKKLTQNIKKTAQSVLGVPTPVSRTIRPNTRSSGLPIVPEIIDHPLTPNMMDSGNASNNSAHSVRPGPPSLTPTVSGISSLSTTFKPKDIMAFVEHLPTFDGTPRYLDRFITSVEEILMLIRGADHTPYGLLTLRTIRNKIVDRADEALELANTPLVWDEIKGNLIRLYSSKKSEASLLSEMSSFSDRQSLGQLFFGLSKIKSQLFSILKNTELNHNIVEAKRTVYNEVCLNAFITGLREPLKTFIRLKAPQTIEQAYEQCQIEQSLYRTNNRGPNETFAKNRRDNQNTRDRRHDGRTNNDRNAPYPNNNYNQQPNSRETNQSSTANPFRTQSGRLNNIEDDTPDTNFQQAASVTHQGT